MIDIQVISLPESSDRRHAVAKQLNSRRIDFRFFDAVDGFGDDPLLKRMDARKFLYRNNRYPIPREAGCYASHFYLWEICEASNRPMLIMEDDFELTQQAERVLHAIHNLIEKYPILKLERLIKNKPRILSGSYHGVDVYRYRKAPHCLLAYSISPDAARKLIKSRENFLYPVDVFVRNFGIHGVPVFGIEPPMVDRGPLNYKSSTIGDRVHCSPWWAAIPRKYFKTRNFFLNFIMAYK